MRKSNVTARCPLCGDILIKDGKVIQTAKEHYYESSNGYGGKGCRLSKKQEEAGR